MAIAGLVCGCAIGWQGTTPMNHAPITRELLAGSVIAVPPLARSADGSLSMAENLRIIRHLEAGGVSTLLYGGNANLYHMRPSEYPALLEFLSQAAAPGTTVIPSVGPAYGVMMDQARLVRGERFPAVMVLPHQGVLTERGVETSIRHFVEAAGTKAVLYIKHEPYIDVEGAAQLVRDGLIAWIKYAIVRDDPAEDEYLKRLVERIDPKLIVSGIGEQPATVHMRDFGVAGFTSGCVCVGPRLSMSMLSALRGGDYEGAERIRRIFEPLEHLRNAIHPIRVLHSAVKLAGIAETGPLLPLLSAVDAADEAAIAEAARTLAAADRASALASAP